MVLMTILGRFLGTAGPREVHRRPRRSSRDERVGVTPGELDPATAINRDFRFEGPGVGSLNLAGRPGAPVLRTVCRV